MPNYICVTCGVQYAPSDVPPSQCVICEDERQYVGAGGQRWTTLEELRADSQNIFLLKEQGLTGVRTEPKFGIGQTAHLVMGSYGNILWDCISLVDPVTVETFQRLGGIDAIAISHPHFYSCVVEWSAMFDGIPIYIHADDRRWVQRESESMVFWEGKTHELMPGLTLIHCGGHFDGSSVLHWEAGADGKSVILTGDTIMPVMDSRYVTFLYSYPNSIPLPAHKIQRILDAVAPFEFDRLYNAFGRVVLEDARNAVMRSGERYIRAITEGL